LTVEEFEDRWAHMLETHGFADNAHLLDMYYLREFFMPSYSGTNISDPCILQLEAKASMHFLKSILILIIVFFDF
jgi:hypothetical protein